SRQPARPCGFREDVEVSLRKLRGPAQPGHGFEEVARFVTEQPAGRQQEAEPEPPPRHRPIDREDDREKNEELLGTEQHGILPWRRGGSTAPKGGEADHRVRRRRPATRSIPERALGSIAA